MVTERIVGTVVSDRSMLPARPAACCGAAAEPQPATAVSSSGTRSHRTLRDMAALPPDLSPGDRPLDPDPHAAAADADGGSGDDEHAQHVREQPAGHAEPAGRCRAGCDGELEVGRGGNTK